MGMMVKLIFNFLSVMSMILPSASRSWSPPPCACATSNVNIRSGPGLSYKILGVLKTSSCLEYIQLDEFSDNLSWSGVLYNHQRAWVAAKWTRLDCTSNSNHCVCAKSNVNIRLGPGQHTSILGGMTVGVCRRAGQEISTGYGRWTSIKYKNQDAFIASEFLDRRDCSRVPPPEPNICVCATGNVNIWSGPGLNHRIIGVLDTGSCQRYYGGDVTVGNQKWAYVQYNGKVAYIASSYLNVQSCDNVQPDIHENCVCATNNVNIRSGPGLSSRILGVLYTGSCQSAGQEISTGNGRWTSVSFNGKKAYIASQFLNHQSCNQPNRKPTRQCACGLTHVKVQSSPSRSSTVLGTLQSGGCLPYIGQLNGQGYSRWVIVKVDFINAYVPADHVTRGPCSPSKTRWLD